jgi:hypothetical protein
MKDHPKRNGLFKIYDEFMEITLSSQRLYNFLMNFLIKFNQSTPLDSIFSFIFWMDLYINFKRYCCSTNILKWGSQIPCIVNVIQL